MKTVAMALAGLLAAGAALAETALTSRATALQAQAQSDAATIVSLAENTRVEVLARKGAWSQVRAGGQTGWVRMMSLKPEGAAQQVPAPGNPLGGLGSLLSAGRSSNSATVTTGVRGLGEEDLQNAQANPAELEKMQRYSVDRNTAQAFALRSRLAPAKVDYLPEPAPAHNNRVAEGG